MEKYTCTNNEKKRNNGKAKCTLSVVACYIMDLLWNVLNSLQWRLVRCGDVSSRWLSLSLSLSLYVLVLVQARNSRLKKNFYSGCPFNWLTGMVLNGLLTCLPAYNVLLIIILDFPLFYHFGFILFFYFYFILLDFILDNFISFFYVFAYTLFRALVLVLSHSVRVRVCCRSFVCLFLCMHLLCYQWRVLVSRVRVFPSLFFFEFFS